MLVTNSPVSSILSKVSLARRPPSAGTEQANTTMGGSDSAPLKKLKGARLGTPSALNVEIQPIGRGTMQLWNGLWGRPWPFSIS